MIPQLFILVTAHDRACIISPSVRFFIGSTHMELLSTCQAIIWYWFPQLDICGNLPVWSVYMVSLVLCTLMYTVCLGSTNIFFKWLIYLFLLHRLEDMHEKWILFKGERLIPIFDGYPLISNYELFPDFGRILLSSHCLIPDFGRFWSKFGPLYCSFRINARRKKTDCHRS